MRALKILGITVTAALVLLLVVAGVLYALVDTAALVNQASQWMQQKYQRSLSVEGKPSLSFFPRIGIELKGARLTEPGSTQVAVQLGKTRLSAAFWPLLRGEVQLDHISLQQPKLVLRQLGEGKTNFDDFLKPQPATANKQNSKNAAPNSSAGSSNSASVALDIASLEIRQGQIEIVDAVGHKTWQLDEINLSTGRIAPAQNLPLEVELRARLNGAKVDSRFKISQFQPLAVNFDATVDDLNLDAMNLGGKTVSKKTTQPETPLNLDALNRLNASGTLRIAKLQVQGLKASQVFVPISAKNGDITLAPLKAQLYGGRLEGLLKLNVPQYRFELRNTFSEVHVGQLVQDALKKNWLDGRGNLNLDLKTSGRTFSALKKNLNGLAKLQLTDGAIKGYNLTSSLNQWQEKLKIFGRSGSETYTGDTQQKTPFSELTASFNIRQGVAFNNDLNLKAQSLYVSGSGYLDFLNNRMDYLARANLTSPGLTVPVRLSGPFDNVAWEVQWSGVGGAALTQPLGKPLNQSVEKLGEKFKGFLR